MGYKSPLTVATGVSVTLSGVYTSGSGISTNGDRIVGYNTDFGGTKFLEIFPLASTKTASQTATATFSFSTPIAAFGAYLTGVGTVSGSLIASFNDGASESFSIQGDPSGGILFAGFTDVGRSISSVTLNEIVPANTGTFDRFGIDDVLYATTSTVPLPASAPMFGAALLALGAVGYGLKRKGAAAV